MTDLSNSFTGAGRKVALTSSTAMKLPQKSPRPQRLAAKAAQRRNMSNRSKSISFAALASAGPLTLDGLYNTQARDKASQIDHLMSSLDLDFDAVAQLFGLYAVSQESGGVVMQKDFATAFLANEMPFELRVAEGVKSVQMAGESLTVPDLRALNYLARLHHATGLAFHDLNTILALPGAAAGVAARPDDPHRTSRRLTSAGLRLLAGYPLYRDAFGLTPAAYAALFGEISPYWHADQIIEDEAAVAGLEQTEVSLLATLFQENAPFVHKIASE